MRPPVAAGDIWDKGRRVCFQAGYLGAHISGRKRSVVEARQGQEKENSQRRPVLGLARVEGRRRQAGGDGIQGYSSFATQERRCCRFCSSGAVKVRAITLFSRELGSFTLKSCLRLRFP